ncbi:MAG: hypothetical protein K1X94_26605 [Sandaracinaceae bacterium]|nr:hypothetical protein [Sandaracinaceae bacterium]
MQRSTVVTLSVLVLGALAFGGWMWWQDAEAERARVEREERREREQAVRLVRQREESMSLMPEALTGVALGMTVEEVRATGHRLEPSSSRPPEGLELTMYEERLTSGAQMMFGFSRGSGHLQQIQVMSLLPRVEAIAPHLQAMNERYGTPSGIWDCPDTQGLPTRRFTWRHAQTAISDVFLLYNGRASLTLYIATPDTIGRSLRMSHCAPVPRERLDQFPTASPEQIQHATVEATGGG